MAALPSYKNPPVVETILGMQFESLDKMRVGHLGKFWALLGEEWPFQDDAPTLEPQFEQFSEADRFLKLALGFRVSNSPECRIRIRNKSRNRMIQIQNGRLILNWLKVNEEPYPRYDVMRTEFAQHFQTLSEFLKTSELGEISPNQWEVTYLNHIPRGTLWSTPKDWGFFRPASDAAEMSGVSELEDLSGNLRFKISGDLGRVHVAWQLGKTSEETEVLVVNLTARGPIHKSQTLMDGLDTGRVAIVQNFKHLMSDKANSYWGIEMDSTP